MAVRHCKSQPHPQFCNPPPNVTANPISGTLAVRHRKSQPHPQFCDLPPNVTANPISGTLAIRHRKSQHYQQFCNPPPNVTANPIRGTLAIRHRKNQHYQQFCNLPPNVTANPISGTLVLHHCKNQPCPGRPYVSVLPNTIEKFVPTPFSYTNVTPKPYGYFVVPYIDVPAFVYRNFVTQPLWVVQPLYGNVRTNAKGVL